jgi:integrase
VTLFLTKDVHPRIVSEILRHSNISITLETYSHGISELGEVAASKIEDAFRGKRR